MDIISQVQQVICFAFHDSRLLMETCQEAKNMRKIVTLFYLDWWKGGYFCHFVYKSNLSILLFGADDSSLEPYREVKLLLQFHRLKRRKLVYYHYHHHCYLFFIVFI